MGNGRCMFVNVFPNAAFEGEKAKGEILRTGQWRYRGRELDITLADLERAVTNFKQFPRDIPLDYHHGSALDDTVEGQRAAGWLSDLSLERYADQEGGVLWGLFSMTPKGAEYVRNGEYRLTSAEFDRNYTHEEKDEEIGMYLLAVALTNRPFVEGLHPLVMLSRDAEALMESVEGVAGSGEPEEVAQETTPALVPAPVVGGNGTEKGNRFMSEEKEIKEPPKIADDAPDSIKLHVSRQDERIKQLEAENKHILLRLDNALDVNRRNKDAVKQMARMKHEAVVDEAIRRQYLDAVERKHALNYFEKDEEGAQEWLNDRQYKAILAKEVGIGSGDDDNFSLESEMEGRVAEARAADASIKSKSEAMSKVFAMDPKFRDRWREHFVSGARKEGTD